MCCLLKEPTIWYEKGKKLLVLIITPIPEGNISLQTSSEIDASLQKLLGGNNTFTLYFTQQQKLSWKRAITWPKFCRWLLILNLTCILQWYIPLQTFNKINASLQKLLSGTNINTPTKSKLKKGHKILQMITNTELDLYIIMIYPSANFQWNQCIPVKVIERKPISTQQQKLSWTRAGVCKILCPQLPDSNTAWLQHCLPVMVTTIQINEISMLFYQREITLKYEIIGIRKKLFFHEESKYDI